MPTSTELNMLTAAGLAPNPYGRGNVAFNYGALLNPAASPGTALTGAGTAAPVGILGESPAAPVGSLGESPGALASDTATGNLNAMPTIETLTNLINQINSQNQQMLNASRLGPSGQAVQDTLLGDVGAWAKGQISPSTVNEMEAIAAQRGAGGGFGVDSPNANAAFMRALGLTSEELQGKALTGYEGLLAANPSAPLYGAQGQLVTPGEYSDTAARQADLQYKYNALNAQLQLEYAKLAAEIAAANQARAGQRGPGGTTTTTATPVTPFPPAPTPKPTPTPDSSAWDWTFTPGATPGGSSLFGGVDYGGGYADLWNPSGVALPPYGSMPDYSQPGPNPMGGLPVDPSWMGNQMDPAWFDYTIGGGV